MEEVTDGAATFESVAEVPKVRRSRARKTQGTYGDPQEPTGDEMVIKTIDPVNGRMRKIIGTDADKVRTQAKELAKLRSDVKAKNEELNELRLELRIQKKFIKIIEDMTSALCKRNGYGSD